MANPSPSWNDFLLLIGLALGLARQCWPDFDGLCPTSRKDLAMKHAVARSIGHNLADSLSSGIGLLIGVYNMDVYGEAARSPDGQIVVDFLIGQVTAGHSSAALANAVKLYSKALNDLAQSQGGSRADFAELTACFWSDRLRNRFSVTVRDRRNRRTTTEYAGWPGRRNRKIDALGRLRPTPVTKDDACANTA